MAGFPDGIFKAFIRFQQTLGCFYFQWFQIALGINLRPLFSWDQQLNDQPPPPRRVMMQVNRSETWFRKVYIVDSYIGPLEGKTIGVGDLWQPTSNTMFWIFMNIYKQLSVVFFAFDIYIYICFFSVRWDVHLHIHRGPHIEPGYAGFVVAWCALNKAPGVTLGMPQNRQVQWNHFFEVILRVHRFETYPTEGQVLSSGLAEANL